MAVDHNSDITLPALDTGRQASGAAPELVLTIVYHPELSRIGERAVLPRSTATLGRNTPGFGRAGQAVRPLQDRHISREALVLVPDGDSVGLRNRPDSCRCRVDGVDLAGERQLGPASLQRGVPIFLAHNVVLLLALSPPLPEAVPCADGLLGSGALMSQLRRQVQQVAHSDLDVLLRGETGTGKEVVAGAIHRASARRDGPLVSVNVAAIPGSLAPAILFGAARGAFTGADRAREGYFQRAAGGTLFLDEIGDAPEEVQPQLLRALQQREIQPVGGDIRPVDLRVISATDADLDGAGFKSALRHRLGALEIRLPPLREHREDIGELLLHYLAKSLRDHGREGLLPDEHSPSRDIARCASLFHDALRSDWPGNVRQLINSCGQLAVASERGLQVPDQVAAAMAGPDDDQSSVSSPDTGAASYRSIHSVSDAEFERAMHDSYHEVAGAAQRLGVSRQAIYRRIEKSPDYRKASDLAEAEILATLGECGGDLLAASRLLRVSASGLRSRLSAMDAPAELCDGREQ